MSRPKAIRAAADGFPSRHEEREFLIAGFVTDKLGVILHIHARKRHIPIRVALGIPPLARVDTMEELLWRILHLRLRRLVLELVADVAVKHLHRLSWTPPHFPEQ